MPSREPSTRGRVDVVFLDLCVERERAVRVAAQGGGLRWSIRVYGFVDCVLGVLRGVLLRGEQRGCLLAARASTRRLSMIAVQQTPRAGEDGLWSTFALWTRPVSPNMCPMTSAHRPDSMSRAQPMRRTLVKIETRTSRFGTTL